MLLKRVSWPKSGPENLKSFGSRFFGIAQLNGRYFFDSSVIVWAANQQFVPSGVAAVIHVVIDKDAYRARDIYEGLRTAACFLN